MDTSDDDLTDDHMRLLLWLDAHPTGSLAAAAQALGLAITDVETSKTPFAGQTFGARFRIFETGGRGDSSLTP